MSIEVINYDNYDKKAILKPSYLIGGTNTILYTSSSNGLPRGISTTEQDKQIFSQ